MMSLLTHICEWAVSPRCGDSAIWAVAFTINTWASSIDEVRTDVYVWVSNKFQAYRQRAIQDRWLAQIEACPDSKNKRRFLKELDVLRKYFKNQIEAYSDAQNV